ATGPRGRVTWPTWSCARCMPTCRGRCGPRPGSASSPSWTTCGSGAERRSARPAAQPLQVDEGDLVGAEDDPAAAGEVGKRLVDRLPGGADQLGELLLGQVVLDQDPLVGAGPEPRRQVEQGLGHPAG